MSLRERPDATDVTPPEGATDRDQQPGRLLPSSCEGQIQASHPNE
jgi:hypothetical protein